MNMHATSPALDLVPLNAVTHTAIRSGDWSNPATWSGGQVPTDWARAHIPAGVEVRVEGEIGAPAKTVRVDGTLSFAADVNTSLKVDTLVTTKTGHLVMGTADAPIASDVTAKVIFADDGALDKTWDPALISRGALLHGKTTINGAEKTAFGAVEEFPRIGDQSLTLKAQPLGWKVGDTLVIAGTDPSDPASDETVTITAIDGATISFQPPLALDHAAPRADLDVHVANLTRNVEFSSENDALAHRGHVMVMHTNDAAISYAAFDDLGRSDKRMGYNDHEFVDLNPFIDPVELGGDNVRGRYALHFHKGGTDKDGAPATVKGSVATDSPSWGFVNHSSHVEFSDNVTHDIVGAAYFTEAGDEIGAFLNNIALRTVNPDMPLKGGGDLVDPDSREDRQDYGFQGDGFWFHGPNVRVEVNIVSGASGHAYIWWPEGLLEKTAEGKTAKVFHDTANVPNGDLIGPDGTRMQIMDVPIGSFDGNQAYSATKGVEIFYLHTEFFGDGLHVEDGTIDPPDAYDAQLRSTLSNTTIWNVDQSAVAAPYANRLVFENLRLVGAGDPNSVGVDLSHFLNNIGLEVKNPSIEGFGVGVKVSTDGEISVEGGSFANNGADVQRVAPTGEDDDEEDDGAVDPEDDEELDDDHGDDDDRGDEDQDDDDQNDDDLNDDDFDDDDLDDEGLEDDRDDEDSEDEDEEDDDSDEDDGDEFEDEDGDEPDEDESDDAFDRADLNHLVGSDDGDRMLGAATADLMEGGAGGDVLKGRGGGDLLIGGAGRDRLSGGGGDDSLDGGAGRDKLRGGAGADTLDGGRGADKLIGGAGADVFIFAVRGRDKVLDFQPGADLLDLTAWEVSEAEALEITLTAAGWLRVEDPDGGASALIRLRDGDEELSEDILTIDDFLL